MVSQEHGWFFVAQILRTSTRDSDDIGKPLPAKEWFAGPLFDKKPRLLALTLWPGMLRLGIFCGGDDEALKVKFLQGTEFIGRQKACMGDDDSLPPGSINSEIHQRLVTDAKIPPYPICIRIELFERILQIEFDSSVALCVPNCFVLRAVRCT